MPNCAKLGPSVSQGHGASRAMIGLQMGRIKTGRLGQIVKQIRARAGASSLSPVAKASAGLQAGTQDTRRPQQFSVRFSARRRLACAMWDENDGGAVRASGVWHRDGASDLTRGRSHSHSAPASAPKPPAPTCAASESAPSAGTPIIGRLEHNRKRPLLEDPINNGRIPAATAQSLVDMPFAPAAKVRTFFSANCPTEFCLSSVSGPSVRPIL